MDKEGRSAIMDYIDKNGLPPKIVPDTRNGVVQFFQSAYGEALIPISTRLKRIHPHLKRLIRKYHESVDFNNVRDMQDVQGWLTKMAELKQKDEKAHGKLEIAILNGWGEEINNLIDEYDMREEYEMRTKVLDDLYRRAVGLNEKDYLRYKQLKELILPDLKNTPKKDWKNEDIRKWLTRNKVKFSAKDTKDKLLTNAEKKIKEYKGKHGVLKKEFDSLDKEVIYDIDYYEFYHPREVVSWIDFNNFLVKSGLEGDIGIVL